MLAMGNMRAVSLLDEHDTVQDVVAYRAGAWAREPHGDPLCAAMRGRPFFAYCMYSRMRSVLMDPCRALAESAQRDEGRKSDCALRARIPKAIKILGETDQLSQRLSSRL